jgi:hypothetical protein
MQSHTAVVFVSIEEFPGEELPGAEQSINPEKWKPPYTDHEQATVSSETRAGGKILRYQGPQYNSHFWAQWQQARRSLLLSPDSGAGTVCFVFPRKFPEFFAVTR